MLDSLWWTVSRAHTLADVLRVLMTVLLNCTTRSRMVDYERAVISMKYKTSMRRNLRATKTPVASTFVPHPQFTSLPFQRDARSYRRPYPKCLG
jgi:hypothetical protein